MRLSSCDSHMISPCLVIGEKPNGSSKKPTIFFFIVQVNFNILRCVTYCSIPAISCWLFSMCPSGTCAYPVQKHPVHPTYRFLHHLSADKLLKDHIYSIYGVKVILKAIGYLTLMQPFPNFSEQRNP